MFPYNTVFKIKFKSVKYTGFTVYNIYNYYYRKIVPVVRLSGLASSRSPNNISYIQCACIYMRGAEGFCTLVPSFNILFCLCPLTHTIPNHTSHAVTTHAQCLNCRKFGTFYKRENGRKFGLMIYKRNTHRVL